MGQARNTILIVDDVELNRDVLSIMFSQSHEIEFAESGPEALDILRKKKEDICAILLDYVMPEMDGLTFLEEAIKEGLVESIPVFLITASLEHDVVHRAYSLGVADYIQRPISPYIAQRRIENIIDFTTVQNKFERLT
jgi:putative two-component system response regulator